MPDLNNIEVIISGQKFKVQSDESKEYIKKIEEMINKKIDNFKESNKKFDNYSSLVFTSFLLADKYLKLVDKLEQMEDNKIKLSEIKDMKNEMKAYKDRISKLEEEKEEIVITKDILEETESRVKELKKELFLLREKKI